MNKLAVERKRKVSPADFVRDHVHGLGRPVIITDATDQWVARSKWDFAFFKKAFGGDFVSVSLGPSETNKLTKLAEFIDYVREPTRELPGFWVDGTTGTALKIAPETSSAMHYLEKWGAFQRHPGLYADIEPAPYFVPDWQLALSPTLRDVLERTCGREYYSVYVGPEGGVSWLHQDYWHTHAYLAQIRGRKRCLLFSPDDTELLYRGAIDPEIPDFERFPLVKKATVHECVIEPGEMLFIPSRWWHHVRSLDKTITVSHNFFNQTNFDEYLSRMLGKLPGLAQQLDESPIWRERLGIEWRLRDSFDRSGK